MISSFKAFMHEIIDYAGLFPPADLSLDTSLQKYSSYRKSDDSWMLSRYIIPASRLMELEPYQDTLFQDGKPYEFSVLGKGTETVSDFEQELENVVSSISQLQQTHDGSVTSDILEIKLPREAVFANDLKLLTDIYQQTAELMNSSDDLPNYVFFEGLFKENWKKEIRLVLEAMSNHNNSFKGGSFQEIGFKLRCGGVEEHMFPSVEQVAFTLNRTREYDLALKCTAGLHHPLRHYADSVKTKMHGFFNVFGGAMLSHIHSLTDEELQEIVRDEDPENFSFEENEFHWKDLNISTNKITELRNNNLISFGSCSFDEPREDLQQLELL